MLAKLALRSLLDRKGSVAIAILAMTISVFALLGIENIRHQAKESFANTVSGVDLIVGAKTGNLNLLLYSVFGIGNPTNNISWESFEAIAVNDNVSWAIPISLGDSHKGFRVLGTTKEYFQHFKYGQKHSLTLQQGHIFKQQFDVVIGADIAQQLRYQIGDKLILAHGIAATSFSHHSESPFRVSGILTPTGTPVDQTLYVSLSAIDAIHSNGHSASQPSSITAAMLGLNSKMSIFNVKRYINNYQSESLLAILPGVALSELWQMMKLVENILLLVAALIFVTSCLGVSSMQLSSVRERKREIQLLRVIGAPPYYLLVLIELEALFITVFSVVLASVLLLGTIALSQDYIVAHFGVSISTEVYTEGFVIILAAMVCVSFITALIPALHVCKNSVNTVRN